MSAADGYPWLVARGDAELMYVSPAQGRQVLAEIDHLRAENHELRGQRDVCQLMWAGEAKKVADICPLLDAIEVAPWLDGMGEEMYAALTALVKWRAELSSPPASH